MQGTLGQHGFGPRTSGGGGGAFATAPKGGGRIQRFTKRGRRAPSCPAGARSVSSGTYGTGANTTSYRDCELRAPRPAPRAAPPPPPPPPEITVTTQVSPAIQTQVSPQISPVMTQMQASPGAGVVAAPQQIAPAPMTSRPSVDPGAEMRRAQEETARRRAEEAERERERHAQRMREQDAYYTEQAEARRMAEELAEQRRAAIAKQSVRAPVPAPAPMGPMVSAPLPAFSPQPGFTPPKPIRVEREPVGVEREPTGLMIPLLIAAAVGVGALVLTTGKKGRNR